MQSRNQHEKQTLFQQCSYIKSKSDTNLCQPKPATVTFTFSYITLHHKSDVAELRISHRIVTAMLDTAVVSSTVDQNLSQQQQQLCMQVWVIVQ